MFGYFNCGIILLYLFLHTFQYSEHGNYNEIRSDKVALKTETEMPCVNHSQPTRFEIRSVLVKCMNTQCVLPPMTTSTALKKSVTFVRENDIHIFSNAKFEQQKIKKCHRKILMTAQMFNKGLLDCKNQYVVIDHVYDPITEHKVKLLNPYILKIKQKPVTQTYNLMFERLLNSKAKEIIHNKNEVDYKGCNVGAKNPLCEAIYHKGEEVPYSTGFCCPCSGRQNENEGNTLKPKEYENDVPKGNECTPNVPKPDLENSETKPKEYDYTLPQPTQNDINCKNTPPKSSSNEKCTTPSKEEDLPKLDNFGSNMEKPDEFSDILQKSNEDDNSKKKPDDFLIGLPKSNVFDYTLPKSNDLFNSLPKPNIYDNSIQKSSECGPSNPNSNEYLNTLPKSNEPNLNMPKPKNCEAKPTEKTTEKCEEKQQMKFDNYPADANYKLNIKAEFTEKTDAMGLEDDTTQRINVYFTYPEVDPVMECLNQTLDLHLGDINTKRKLNEPYQKVPGKSYRGKRHIKRYIHPRGGQDCKDKYTPPKVNPQTYHDSTHCLKFSDVWYSVYQLQKPVLEHSVQIQIFEKFEDENCNVRWHDLTGGSFLEVGTSRINTQNSGPTISLSYISKCSDKFKPALDINKHRLLIPDTIRGTNIFDYPEVTGGPPDYLVIPKNLISSDGKECNKAGVGYEAFYKQPKRCSVPAGTCLGNQPSDLWEHDHEAEMNGEKGSYFLKFFGNLPPDPVKENKKDHTQTVSLYYEDEYINQIQVEFRADHNTVLKPHISAIITEVHIDSTSPGITTIKVKVINSGLVSSIFYISLANCPLNMPASFNNIASKPVLIQPQHQHIFIMNVQCGIPETSFFCTVQVLNTKQELIAIRRIRILKNDRCICVWYCRCTCFLEDDGLKCTPLSLDNYNAAGYQGSLPVPIPLIEYTLIDDVLSILLYLFVFVCSTLLIMGLTKALIGWFCCIAVGLWGFDVILNLPKRINRYHEPHLSGRDVEYSSSGWPIHPDTKEKVRAVPPATEFCLNVVFFFVYPVVLTAIVIKKICCKSYRQDEPARYGDSEDVICECPFEEELEEEKCECCKCDSD